METFVLGGISCMVAAFVTNPVDVIKVRMQIKGEKLKDFSKRPSFFQTTLHMKRNEGLKSFYRGLAPSLLRESTYSTLRMGLYGKIKKMIKNDKDNSKDPLWKLIISGAIAGGIGSAFANPTDIVKVKAQAFEGIQTSTFTIIKHIYKQDGLIGFYRGVLPSCIRAIILTASQLPSYEYSKNIIKEHTYIQEGVPLHFMCSMLAGFVCATTTSPVDLVKSRYMSQEFLNGRGVLYKSMLDCFKKTFNSEGLRGLYSGWIANWLRIGPHTIVTFIVLEQLRKALSYHPF